MIRKLSPRRAGFAWSVAALGLALNFVPVTAQSQQVSKEEPAKAAPSKEAIQNMPRLQEKGVMTVTGSENWDAMTGFGKDSTMAQMMTLMMVGGSGMEHMHMGAMKPGATNASTGDMAMGNMAAGTAQGLPVTVTLTPNPPIVGDNTLDVLVMDADGKPVTGLKLAASVAMTSMDMGTTRPQVVEGKDGHYAVTANFSMKGPWRVTLAGSTPDKKMGGVQAALDFNVGGKDKWVQPAGWKVTLNTKLETLKVGKNTLDFNILDPTGKPVTGAKVTSSVAMTSMDMGTTHPKAQAGKDGHYTTEAEFSMKGPWRVTFTVTPPKQKPFTQSFDFSVAQ